MAQLRPARARRAAGQVVLVDFWTLTCINWLRTAPYIRAWSRAYRDDGLVVIGAHTPEFSFEHELDLVRRATQERGIDYPVAVDNDYGIWDAFANRYWPALYFVDAGGIIRHHHFGEGAYEQSERVIQRLLGIERELVSVEGVGVEAEADWDHLRTPETYLGDARSAGFDILGLAGQWTVGPENVVLDEGRRKHRLPLPRTRRAPRAVIRSARADSLPRASRRRGSRGVAGRGRGRGRERLLRDGRLYQLVREPDAVRERTLEITFLEPGAEAYVFTFG